jgi:hypothetical protein
LMTLLIISGLYFVIMYIAPYPITMRCDRCPMSDMAELGSSILSTNVYGERALGIFEPIFCACAHKPLTTTFQSSLMEKDVVLE